MDFKETIKNAGTVTQEIGAKLIEVAEKEDIGALRPLAKQLRDIMDILNVITYTDQLARGSKNN